MGWAAFVIVYFLPTIFRRFVYVPQHVVIIETASNDAVQIAPTVFLRYKTCGWHNIFQLLAFLHRFLKALLNLCSAIPRNVIIACFFFGFCMFFEPQL